MGPFCSPAGNISAPVAIDVADRFARGPVFLLALLLACADAAAATTAAAVVSMKVEEES